MTAFLMFGAMAFAGSLQEGSHKFNGPYTGENLSYVNFPIGGLGSGMYCLEGTGAITQMSVEHEMEFFNNPYCYAAVTVQGKDGKNTARVLEGPLADWKHFGIKGAANGMRHTTFGLPRFRKATFLDRFPFATIDLSDGNVPLKVRITGWSPFTPGDPDSSGLPVGALEYTFTNTSDQPQKAMFSFNAENFFDRKNGSIGSIPDGFVLYRKQGKKRDKSSAFAFFIDGEKDVIVDHCWFRGGWFDKKTVTWNNIENFAIPNNPPVQHAEGASLAVPFTLKPGETKTIRLMTAWYVPTSKVRSGARAKKATPAFETGPSKGTAKGQNTVSGFLGHGLVNSFDPKGDGSIGTLTSPEFTVNKKYLHFLVGGGAAKHTEYVGVLVGDKLVFKASGKDSETLKWVTCDLSKYQGKKAKIQIVDNSTGGWGHIMADEFILSNSPIATLRDGNGNAITAKKGRYDVLADFEGKDFGKWVAESKAEKACDSGTCAGGECSGGKCEIEIPDYYVPWYATQFKSVHDVAQTWKDRYDELRKRSETFRDAFYDSTLPPEVIEAVAANLAILKSPTVLRQHDGRLWCWEGCCDGHGCCAGSCTHVWNYAQAICHLFPSMERSLRRTEFNESQTPEGHQTFRSNLPITEATPHYHAASDGQLGGIMKFYRDWTISGNDKWLKREWPNIKTSLNYMIKNFDPRHTGLLEEEHHNTYDINYFGPDGHCGSFYLGALAAAIEMGRAVGDDVKLYEELLAKGKKRMVKDLFNGEYFIQIIQKEGLDHNYKRLNPDSQSKAYREMAKKISDQGPKYQYGNGCLSDGILGLWMAKVCGLDEEIIDDELVKKHLKSVHKYNLKKDLSRHVNPQRPTFAMGDDGGLLLCTWPHGDALIIPFVYSNEVWTGIEYQVAAHLMLMGCVDEGLDIVRACRKRYDGARRNPFDEYECGHFYGRALSSYSMLQGLTGVRYDARTKTLYVDSKVGDFRSFLSTATGFGVVELKDGKVTVDVRRGSIPVENIVVGNKK
ncbi:MAG: GH116 family glycosyl hydrolase [Planctomycetia bacterium]|jgi:uncharacterized protein YqkB